MTQKMPIYILFGATGDLAHRKIVPALEKTDIEIIAFSRRPWMAPLELEDRSSNVIGTFDNSESYKKLKEEIEKITQNDVEKYQLLFHFAIQPEFYETVAKNIAAVGLKGKLLVEKPFGFNLESAQHLQTALEHCFKEEDIYRIDHFLSKQGLRAIHLTDDEKKNIQEVHVRLLENIDIQGRGEFYDQVGALRDVGQNHCLEMFATLFYPARAEALASLSKNLKSVERKQYKGYTAQESIKSDSQTETYFKIETTVHDNIIVTFEAGKAMPEKISDIMVKFKDGSQKIFNIEGKDNAYELVIKEAVAGDKSHFVSKDEVMASWTFIESVMSAFKNTPLEIYENYYTQD